MKCESIVARTPRVRDSAHGESENELTFRTLSFFQEVIFENLTPGKPGRVVNFPKGIDLGETWAAGVCSPTAAGGPFRPLVGVVFARLTALARTQGAGMGQVMGQY